MMDAKRIAIGTVVGGITMFVVGYLVFDMAMVGFYETNGAGFFGYGREAKLWWAVALGIASLATLVTLCIEWSGAKNATQGFKIGGMVGFLVWFGVDFINVRPIQHFHDQSPTGGRITGGRSHRNRWSGYCRRCGKE